MKKALLLTFVLLFTLSLNAQWVEQTSGVTTALATLSAVNQNVCWAAGDGGVVLKTTNGGTSWVQVNLSPAEDIYNIFALDANNALITTTPTSPAKVYRTTNGGTTWTQVLSQVGGFIDAMWMFNSTQGFLMGDPVGSRWTLFKTNDGGATWDSTGMYLAQNGSEAGWNNGIFVSGNDVYFGTNSQRMYKSTNKGATWTAQTVGLTNSFGIWFNTPTKGLVGGSTQGIYGTTNGGTNWTAVTIPSGTGTIYSVVGAGSKWFYIRGSIITKSTNDGTAWVTEYTSPSSATYQAMGIPRDGSDVCWAVGTAGVISKGANLGLPVELTSFSAASLNGAVELNWETATEKNNRGFEIERKSGSGEFLPVGFVTGKGTTTESVKYSYTDNTVEAGTFTYRLKQHDFDGTYAYSKEVEVVVTTPADFNLSQNYPNPFNPSTVINYSLPSSGLVKLSVYNLLGQEVKSLVNEFKEAGSYQVTFDASNMPSGTYFYKIESGSFNVTKKMQLTK